MRFLPCAAGAALLLALAAPARAQQPAPPGEPPPAPAGAPEPPAEEPGDKEPEDGGAEPAQPAPTPPPPAAAPAEKRPVAAATPAVVAPQAREPGLRERLRARLGPLTLTTPVLLQVQASPYVGEDSFLQAGDIAERPGFRLRRARLGLKGDLEEVLRFAIAGQLGSEDSGEMRLHEAWAGYTALPYLKIFAGARDVPFSRSALTGAEATALVERPFAVRAIAPFKQVGVQVEGELADGAFGYQAGAFNGFQRSDQFYAGHDESYAPLGNRFEGTAVAGRVATEPLGPLGRTIQDLERSPFRFGAGASAFYSHGGARTLAGAGGDVLVHASGLHLLAEVLWLRAAPQEVPSQPITQVTSISSVGLVGEVGYMIVPRIFGVSARVEWIDPDPEVDNEGDDVITSAGVSYHAFEDILRAQLEYTHREEIHGLSLANDALTLQLQLSL